METARNRVSDGPAALSGRDVAECLGVSLRHIRRMESAQMLGPKPFRLGRCVRYDANEIREWVRAGCPDRATWNRRKENRT